MKPRATYNCDTCDRPLNATEKTLNFLTHFCNNNCKSVYESKNGKTHCWVSANWPLRASA